MSKYAPHLVYLCDDYDCCENGCPSVTCRYCGKEWPCADYIANHTPEQVESQHRYVDRKWYPREPEMVKYSAICRALQEKP